MLIPSPSIRLGKFFLDFNFKRLYRSSGRGKENRFRLFTSSTKREIRHFHEVWCSCSNGKQNVRKKRKEKKRAASAKMLLLISKPTPLLTFSLSSPSLLLKLLSVLLQTADLQLPCLIQGRIQDFFLGGGALVSCSTSTPINHIYIYIYIFAEYQLY